MGKKLANTIDLDLEIVNSYHSHLGYRGGGEYGNNTWIIFAFQSPRNTLESSLHLNGRTGVHLILSLDNQQKNNKELLDWSPGSVLSLRILVL